MYSVKNT